MWQVIYLAETDSTNDEAKRRAAAGQTDLAVIAEAQTAGKGRRGRSFLSLAGKGLYLSVLFRPKASPEQISAITAWTAVAVCRAIEQVCGGGEADALALRIKWPNDVLAGGKKLCGILTELVGDQVVIGMGVNLTQTGSDFGADLAGKAVSLAQLGVAVDKTALESALLAQLTRLAADFPDAPADYLADYRRRCVTLGRDVVLAEPTGERPARALDVDDRFGLLVRLDGGEERTVTSGEVSVRGLWGYT